MAILGLTMLLLGVVVVVAVTRQADNPPQLTRSFEASAAIHFSYPADWNYYIPVMGVIIAAPDRTLNDGSPGPALTIQRMYPVSVYGSVEGALKEYLDRGPLQKGANWQIIKSPGPTTFQNKPAVAIELRGTDGPENTPMYLRALATTADNTFVYLLIVTVPIDSQAHHQPVLDAILASVEIRE